VTSEVYFSYFEAVGCQYLQIYCICLLTYLLTYEDDCDYVTLSPRVTSCCGRRSDGDYIAAVVVRMRHPSLIISFH